MDKLQKNKGQLKVLLSAGGSGGHIFPCVSLASELEKEGVRNIFFVSSRRRLDKSILKDLTFPRFFLSVNPMPRSFSPKSILVFIFKCLCDLVTAFFIILKTRPDVVVGFGGYSSGAVSLMAKFCGIKLVIHEQNILPGRANVILSRFADLIALSFASSSRYFGKYAKKTVFTGNPIRPRIKINDRRAAAERLGVSPEIDTVLVMGGSQGSSFLNHIMLGVFLDLQSNKSRAIQFIHITGQGDDFSVVEGFFNENALAGKVFSFLESIDDAYSASDLVVSRSGAAAIFELAFYGKPMILIPYPNPKNNQNENAAFFRDAGAAILREEKKLSREDLVKDIRSILENEEQRVRMRAASLKLAFPESGKVLAGQVLRIAMC